MTVKLGKVIQVDVRKAWPNEAAHFTPWLAFPDGLELLQEALGMDLEVEAMEQFVGPFRADILAKRTDTPDEHWVLIENQLERTDHRHLGQLLTYAAGLKAATIVWVAQDFSEEHRAALDWLNDITSEDYQFFGLQIELWQIGESDAAPRFKVLANPNQWTREVQKSAQAKVTDLDQLKLRFWEAFAERQTAAKGSLKPKKPGPRHWMDWRLPRKNTWLAACFHTQKKRVWVEFSVREYGGKVWFEELLAQKAEIEAKVGAPLSWERLQSKQSRIALYRENTDPTVEANWAEQQTWMIEQVERFRTIFTPYALALSDLGGAGSSLADDDLEGADED